MSDWKSRAKVVETPASVEGDWKSRAKPVSAPVAEPAADEPGWFDPGSQSDAVMMGGSRGASFGFRDELAGGVKGLSAGFARVGTNLLKTPAGRAALRALTGVRGFDAEVDGALEAGVQEASKLVYDMPLPLDPDQALDEGYRFGRQESRGQDLKAQQAHPVTYGVSEVAGTMMAPGPKFAKAGTPGRFASIAKTGAGIGAASALGNSNSDLTRYENDPQVIVDAVGDTALGAGAGGIMAPVAAVGADKAGRYLQTAAKDNALKAIGLKAGISNELTKRGYTSVDEARELGQAALDMQLIRPGRTAADVLERARFGKEMQGARIEGALQTADDARLQPFDTESAAWKAATEAMGPEGLSPTAIREATRARRLVDDIVKLPQVQEPSFANANAMKSDMYAGINYGKDPALKTTLERRAASGLRKSIEEQVADVAGPDTADELRAANKAYGWLSDIEPMALDESTRQAARKSITAFDMASIAGAGAAGHSMGGAGAGAGAAALAAGSKLLGPRIPSTLAVTQEAFAPRVGRFIQESTKPALQAPLRPSVKDDEDAINAFLAGG